MLVTQLKYLMSSLAYCLLQFITIFAINLKYSETVTYYIYGQLFKFNTLYAIQVYEIIITKIFLAFIVTTAFIIPLFWYHFLLYVAPALHEYELNNMKKSIIKNWIIIIIETIIFIFFIKPQTGPRGGFLYGSSEGPIGWVPLREGICEAIYALRSWSELMITHVQYNLGTLNDIKICDRFPALARVDTCFRLGGRDGKLPHTTYNVTLPDPSCEISGICPELNPPSGNNVTRNLEQNFSPCPKLASEMNYNMHSNPEEINMAAEIKKVAKEAVMSTDILSVKQIYTYSNVTRWIVLLIFIWIMATMFIKFFDKIEEQRRIIILGALLVAMWVIPPEIKILIKLTIIITLYLEIVIWGKKWIINKESAKRKIKD